MTLLDLFKKVHPSVLAAKMIFKHLQENHQVLKISDIAETTSGGTPNRGIIEYYNGSIPWVKSGELKDDIITSCDEYITEEGLKNSSAKLFPKGTLLVAMYGANIGKTGILDFEASTNQAICAVFPKVAITKEYLYWYFKQQRLEFIEIGKGGAQPNISQTVINNASIALPEMNYQKKIVDFLETIEQKNYIDINFFIPEVLQDVERICRYKDNYLKLSECYTNQLTLIENLNQAILQDAVQGKLLPERNAEERTHTNTPSSILQSQNPTNPNSDNNATNHHPKNLESAHDLLKRIKAEKAKSGKKEKPLPPIRPEEIPFEIPDNWVWCRLGEVIYDTEGGKSPNCIHVNVKGDDWGVLKTTSVQQMVFIENENKMLPNNFKVQQQHIVNENDVLITRAGPFNRVGVVCCVTNLSKNLILSDKTIRIKQPKHLLNSMYLALVYNSPLMKPIIADKMVGMAESQVNISQESMKSFLFPLPPLSEQKRIVAEIEKQLAKTKQLKEHVLANQEATEQLLKALLHEAFEVEK